MRACGRGTSETSESNLLGVSPPPTSRVPVFWEPWRRDSGRRHPCLFLPRSLCCAEWILEVGLQLEGGAPWSDSEGPAPSELH